MAWAESGGFRFYYEDHGSGFPLVLLPGLGMRPEQWAAYLPALSARRRVLVIDLRGGPRSCSPPGPYSTEELAGDIVCLLHGLGIQQTDVLGMSLGGFVAQELSLGWPGLVRRQVLALTGLSASGRGRERLRVELRLRETPELLELYYRSLFLWLLDDSAFEDEEAIEIMVAGAVGGGALGPLQGFQGQVSACLDHDCTTRARGISQATLVIGGAKDLVYPPPQTRQLADTIPGAQYCLVDCPHLPGGAAARAIAAEVLRFLGPAPARGQP